MSDDEGQEGRAYGGDGVSMAERDKEYKIRNGEGRDECVIL
jgi:hypothetical protein